MREHLKFSIKDTQKHFKKLYKINAPSKSTIYRWEKNGYQYEYNKRKEIFRKVLIKIKPGKNAKAKDWEKWTQLWQEVMGSP